MYIFGERLKLSHITAVPQTHFRPHLIINLLAQPDKSMPSVNNTTDREIAPESIQFWRALPRILQVIWEEDPAKCPVWVSKIDVMDTYHRGTLQPSQVGTFMYVFPSAPDNNCIIIYIELVLPMG